MNRIRRIGNIYQVLITPTIQVSPDSALMIGAWDDSELRNFYVLEFDNLRDAEYEAYKHPDIDWYRLVVNHKYIYERLEINLKQVISNSGFTVDFRGNLMDPDTLKHTMFDRVINGGDRFSMKFGMSDIITFHITNPWTSNLHKLSKAIENTRAHPYRDDLRVRNKKIIDNKTIILTGVTEFGSVYEIKLMPNILFQYGEWYKKIGFTNPQNADKIYKEMLVQQDKVDQLTLR
jgi:hypothetical protein